MLQSIDLAKPPPEELHRGSRLGKYELISRIGRGGMATVWVAREHGKKPEEQRIVAVKAILTDLANDPEFSTMFLDEGRITQKIRHPNVVDVYEAGDHDGIHFIAMEWVEGDSLHAIIAEAGKRRPIPPEMAVRVIADAAAGLHAAHELKDENGEPLNVVHRDVSPHNILIGVDGAIKLVDFGVAKAMGRISEVTSAGQLKGKFGYMSPEQAMAKKVDRRSDVFALGIVLFELTTGRRLFRGEHDAETLHMVVSGKIPKPASLIEKYPEGLEKIVLQALQRDPAKRYQTALELQTALESHLKSERIVVPRNGIANLLKKVLGARLEQRRKAIRSSVRALDGQSTSLPATENPLVGEHGSVTGVSAISSGTGSGVISSPISSPSGLSNPTASSVSWEASNPNAVSQRISAYTPPTVVVKRGGTVGLVIGVLGLAVALGVIVFLLLNPSRKTTVVNVGSPAPVETEASKPELKQPEKPADTTGAVTLDALKKGTSTQSGPARGPTTGKKETTAPAATAPPRKNPYE